MQQFQSFPQDVDVTCHLTLSAGIYDDDLEIVTLDRGDFGK